MVCTEDCSPGGSQTTEGIRQFRIEPRGGNNFTIESFANSQTYQAARNGNRLTWNASYQFLGEQWQETGSFTINGDGTLTLNISYTRSTELETCTGTCTGTGFHL